MGGPARTGDGSRSAPSSTRVLWVVWAIWLLYLSYPISNLLDAHPSPVRLILTFGGTGIFVAVYLWTAWRFVADRAASAPRPAGRALPTWFPIIILVSLAVALSLGDGKAWLELFVFTSAIVGICLPLRLAPVALGVLVLLMTAIGLAARASWSDIGQTIFVIAITGLCVISLVWVVATNRALRMAREEIARLAVSEERLRFARDLHDLLGHSLSLIALKSELAGRLATASPVRAASEMRDVETVARNALQEVRAAVAGYRQPTLTSELHGAQEILTAAGIAYSCEGEPAALPAAVEAVLSWAVREGVTNVIRHSRARRCTIRLTQDGQQAGVSVIDDGRGASGRIVPLGVAPSGSGLAGLAERVAALGGRCEVGAQASGGFRVTVTVPLTRDPGAGTPLEAAKSA